MAAPNQNHVLNQMETQTVREHNIHAGYELQPVNTKDVLFTTHIDYPGHSLSNVQIAAHHYRKGTGLSADTPGIVLFFMHGIGHHKEMWEPMLEELLLLEEKGSSKHAIQEAWAVDYETHGESAILNEETLKAHPKHVATYEAAEIYARIFQRHLAHFKPSIHSLVAIGHSAGCVITSVLQLEFGRANHIPYTSMILIEPALKAHYLLTDHTDVYLAVKSMTATRRDIWNSRTDAKTYFAQRLPWITWDRRVLDKYVEYGLRELPTAIYPKKTGVTLCTPRQTEAEAWVPLDATLVAMNRLNQVSTTVPVHLVFGEREELYSDAARKSLSSPLEGRVIASESYVSNAGHLVVQEQPKLLAENISHILNKIFQ
ncbi:Alpha/beta hydrolase family-domain-containing protein [Lentinula lateritia]|nr:Alpha/beta hydrolase family-domain-containing protein [Lentinula lateritia]